MNNTALIQTTISNKVVNDYLYFNSRDEFDRIDISRIICFEADGNYTNIILTNKLKVVIGISMSRMEQYISDSLKEKASCFVRIGKSCILNLNYILKINVLKQHAILTDYEGTAYQVNISKEALKRLKDIMVASVLKNSTDRK